MIPKIGSYYEIEESIGDKKIVIGPMKSYGIVFLSCNRGFAYNRTDGIYFSLKDRPERDLGEEISKEEAEKRMKGK